MNKKILIAKLLLNPRVRRTIIRGLKNEHIRRLVIKQAARRLRRG